MRVGKPLNAATKQILFEVRFCNSNTLKVKKKYCTRPQKKALIGLQEYTCEETIAQ